MYVNISIESKQTNKMRKKKKKKEEIMILFTPFSSSSLSVLGLNNLAVKNLSRNSIKDQVCVI